MENTKSEKSSPKSNGNVSEKNALMQKWTDSKTQLERAEVQVREASSALYKKFGAKSVIDYQGKLYKFEARQRWELDEKGKPRKGPDGKKIPKSGSQMSYTVKELGTLIGS